MELTNDLLSRLYFLQLKRFEELGVPKCVLTGARYQNPHKIFFEKIKGMIPKDFKGLPFLLVPPEDDVGNKMIINHEKVKKMMSIDEAYYYRFDFREGSEDQISTPYTRVWPDESLEVENSNIGELSHNSRWYILIGVSIGEETKSLSKEEMKCFFQKNKRIPLSFTEISNSFLPFLDMLGNSEEILSEKKFGIFGAKVFSGETGNPYIWRKKFRKRKYLIISQDFSSYSSETFYTENNILVPNCISKLGVIFNDWSFLERLYSKKLSS